MLKDHKYLVTFGLTFLFLILCLLTLKCSLAYIIIPEDDFENDSFKICNDIYYFHNLSGLDFSNKTLDCLDFFDTLRRTNDTVYYHYNLTINYSDLKTFVTSYILNTINVSKLVNDSLFYESLEDVEFLIPEVNESKYLFITDFFDWKERYDAQYDELKAILNDLTELNLSYSEKRSNHEYRMALIEQGILLDSDGNPIQTNIEVDLSPFVTKEEVDLKISQVVSNMNQPSTSSNSGTSSLLTVAVIVILIAVVAYLLFTRLKQKEVPSSLGQTTEEVDTFGTEKSSSEY
jgi:hypothetical protein